MTGSLYEDFKLPEEAAEWLMRLAEDDSSECRRGFYAWFRQSPRHIEAFFEATAVSQALSGMDIGRQIDVDALIGQATTNVVALAGTAHKGQIAESKVPRRPPHRLKWTIAACVAVLTAMGGLASLTLNGGHSMVTTGIGEQRTLKLDDGSLVILNTRSQVRIHFSGDARDVQLLDGEALFVVARDLKRPFRVSTRDATVQAIGTQFDVHKGEHGTRVVVIEGAVQVMADEQQVPGRVSQARFGAGEVARVSRLGELHRQALANPAAAAAWRERRLEFHDAALTEVAAEFNRYNQLQIRIEGPLNTDQRITGIFSADSPEALVKFLRRDGSLTIERQDDGFIVQRRSQVD